MSTKLNPEEIAAMKKSVDRSRAYGLMRGCVDGLLMRLPKDERPRIERLMRDADELWEPIAIDEQSDPISQIKAIIEP